MGRVRELTDSERVKLIKKALKECGQRVTSEAVAKQFKHETGRKYEGD